VNVIAKGTLRAFWEKHPTAKGPLEAWSRAASKATWTSPTDIKNAFGTNVDFVADDRVIFDIGGNKYRLIARIAYAPFNRVLIKFIGTHAEYDKVDARTV
jgi:mRNA interferase HigB